MHWKIHSSLRQKRGTAAVLSRPEVFSLIWIWMEEILISEQQSRTSRSFALARNETLELFFLIYFVFMPHEYTLRVITHDQELEKKLAVMSWTLQTTSWTPSTLEEWDKAQHLAEPSALSTIGEGFKFFDNFLSIYFRIWVLCRVQHFLIWKNNITKF